MQKQFWNKASIIIISAILATACSTLKHPKRGYAAGENQSEGTAQTEGTGTEGGFDEQSATAANKLKVANQVYYFDFDKYEFREEDRASLEVQSEYLASHPKARVRLEGNADERGSREYNVALGWRRAEACANFLQQKGVSPQQIKKVSFGKEKPMDFGHNEEAYQLNRRVNLVYEAK